MYDKKNNQIFTLHFQCRCTSRDLERMSGIISNKLGMQNNSPPITTLTFLRLYYNIFKLAAKELEVEELFNYITLRDLELRLEFLICDASCSVIRASELALVLICTQMDIHVTQLPNFSNNVFGLVDYAIELQKLCRVS